MKAKVVIGVHTWHDKNLLVEAKDNLFISFHCGDLIAYTGARITRHLYEGVPDEVDIYRTSWSKRHLPSPAPKRSSTVLRRSMFLQ